MGYGNITRANLFGLDTGQKVPITSCVYPYPSDYRFTRK
jgi:hypothetical protein